jgi:phosphoribosylglycinamide formyltransferase-1
MINIHPSLLPEFKGLRTHQQALDAQARVHGASVHYVTSELDGGPVIAQARVAVEAGDDAARLAERVLQREHPLLVATLREISVGRITWDNGGVHFDGRPLRAPLQLDHRNQLVQEQAV